MSEFLYHKPRDDAVRVRLQDGVTLVTLVTNVPTGHRGQ